MKVHVAIDGVNEAEVPQEEPSKALDMDRTCNNCGGSCEIRTAAPRAKWCRKCETLWKQDEEGNWVAH